MVDDFESRIGASMTIHGEVECRNRLILEGSLRGSFTGSQLFICKTGKLEGRVKADTIECFGQIKGNVKTRSLDLKSTGSHMGTVETCELKVELGAVLDCALQSGAMQAAGPTQSQEKRTTEKKLQLADLVGAYFEDRRACCFDIPWSERLEMYNHLLDLLDKDKSLIKIIGDKGSGKTVLAEKLKIDLKAKYKIVEFTSQVGSVSSLLMDVAKGLDIAGIHESMKQSDLLAAIQTFLAEGRARGEKALLIIDDSQEMYPASMEGITHLLTGNFGAEAGFLHIVLLGTKETEAKMVATIFDYFEDETNCQLCLEPLNIKDTAEYLRFCLQTMQVKDAASTISLLPYETIKVIHVASGGNIAKINELADKAIRAAARARAARIDPHYVQ